MGGVPGRGAKGGATRPLVPHKARGYPCKEETIMNEQITRRNFLAAGVVAAGVAAAAGATSVTSAAADESPARPDLDLNLRYAKILGCTVPHENPAKAARYIRDLWNGRPCDERLAYRIAQANDSECEMVIAAGLVLQYAKPGAIPGSQEFFDECGSMVYTHTVVVDDVAAAVEAMEAAGGTVVAHLQGDERMPYNAIFDGEGEPIEYAVVDCRQQCGLVFDILQKNDQLVCRTGAYDPQDVAVFQHTEVVLEDAQAAADWMVNVLGAELVEDHIYTHITEMSGGTTVHTLWGGFVFQLIERGMPGWGEHLDTYGPSTHNFQFKMRPTMRSNYEQCELLRAAGANIINDEEYSFIALYGEDANNANAKDICLLADTYKDCGCYWEVLVQDYHWPSLTGYFFAE